MIKYPSIGASKMNCALCMQSRQQYVDLFNADGEQTPVYEITMKFFKMQDTSKVICTECWRCIDEFHTFQATILAAQKQHEELLLFEEFVKVEAELEVAQMLLTRDIVVSSDPVKVEAVADVPAGLSDNEDRIDNASSDDEPLQPRRILRSTSTHVKTQPPVTRKRKKSKPSKEQTVISKALALDNLIAEKYKQELPCELCGEVEPSYTALQEHFRSRHNAQKCYVTCCQRKYYHRGHLIDHLNYHLNPQLYACGTCGKACRSKRSLSNHFKSLHGPEAQERRYACHICEKRFTKKAILQGHMDTHATGEKEHVCPHCGKGFVLQHRLNIHIRNVHGSTCVCEQCGRSFNNRYALKSHLQEHAGVPRKKWSCDQCEAQLYSKYSLGRHKRMTHHDGSTVYVCSECGKVAFTDEALRSHKRYMHENERKYKCSICSKAFKVAVVLKEHMTTHTGEELYKCPHCPRTFRVSANMHHHRKRMHPKEWEDTRRRRLAASPRTHNQASTEVLNTNLPG